MKKIGVYNEPHGGSIGGSEYLTALLAENLAAEHDVELVHHRHDLTKAQLENLFGLEMTRVRLRYVEPVAYEGSVSHNPFQRYRHARQWHADLSEGYDLFVASVHNHPPFCHARAGALIVLFPFYVPPYSLSDEPTDVRRRTVWTRWSPAYHKWEWEQRLSSYQVKTAISEFTREWAARWWKIDCRVWYPPADTNFPQIAEQNHIISVGRFSVPGEGHQKNQREMLAAFRTLATTSLRGWQFRAIGTSGDSDKHRDYLAQLTAAADGLPVQFLPNLDRRHVKEELATAKIFWHAAGYGESQDTDPQLAEHYGIATVEAMAAGCVPVVINHGAQAEIVQHGYNGYLWDTLDQLQEYTALLAHDEAWRQKLSRAAKERAAIFSAQNFVERGRTLMRPIFGSQ